MKLFALGYLCFVIISNVSIFVYGQDIHTKTCGSDDCSDYLFEGVVTRQFSPNHEEYINYKVGDVIKVFAIDFGDRHDLWEGELNGKRGKFYASHVDRANYDAFLQSAVSNDMTMYIYNRNQPTQLIRTEKARVLYSRNNEETPVVTTKPTVPNVNVVNVTTSGVIEDNAVKTTASIPTTDATLSHQHHHVGESGSDIKLEVGQKESGAISKPTAPNVNVGNATSVVIEDSVIKTTASVPTADATLSHQHHVDIEKVEKEPDVVDVNTVKPVIFADVVEDITVSNVTSVVVEDSAVKATTSVVVEDSAVKATTSEPTANATLSHQHHHAAESVSDIKLEVGQEESGVIEDNVAKPTIVAEDNVVKPTLFVPSLDGNLSHRDHHESDSDSYIKLEVRQEESGVIEDNVVKPTIVADVVEESTVKPTFVPSLDAILSHRDHHHHHSHDHHHHHHDHHHVDESVSDIKQEVSQEESGTIEDNVAKPTIVADVVDESVVKPTPFVPSLDTILSHRDHHHDVESGSEIKDELGQEYCVRENDCKNGNDLKELELERCKKFGYNRKESEKESSNSSVKDLEHVLQIERDLKAKLESDIKKLMIEKEQLLESNSFLDKQLSECERKNGSLVNQLDLKISEENELKIEKDQLLESNSFLNKQLSECERKNGSLVNQLDLKISEEKALQSELQIMKENNTKLEQHLSAVCKEDNDATSLVSLRQTIESMKETHKKADQRCLEAETRLNVLTEYFNKKETELQKQLGTQNVLSQQNQQKLGGAEEELIRLKRERESYDDIINDLKREVEDQEKQFQKYKQEAEKQKHEYWIQCRQAERERESLTIENGYLRRKLTEVTCGNVNSVVGSRKQSEQATDATSSNSSDAELAVLTGGERTKSPLEVIGPPPLPIELFTGTASPQGPFHLSPIADYWGAGMQLPPPLIPSPPIPPIMYRRPVSRRSGGGNRSRGRSPIELSN